MVVSISDSSPCLGGSCIEQEANGGQEDKGSAGSGEGNTSLELGKAREDASEHIVVLAAVAIACSGSIHLTVNGNEATDLGGLWQVLEEVDGAGVAVLVVGVGIATGVDVGELVDIYVYEDTDGDGDPGTGAVFLGSVIDAAVQANDGINWSVYPFPF